LRQTRPERLALIAPGHERMVDGWAAAGGEERMDLSAIIARFGAY
jgi:hypothetical protein